MVFLAFSRALGQDYRARKKTEKGGKRGRPSSSPFSVDVWGCHALGHYTLINAEIRPTFGETSLFKPLFYPRRSQRKLKCPHFSCFFVDKTIRFYSTLEA